MSGGVWVTKGSIKVWRERAEEVTPEPPPIDVHDLIACPTCRCRVDETCRTPNGRSRRPHVLRLAPRLCGCGELPEPRRQLCEACGIESLRVSKRDYMRRLRSAYRKAA